MDDEQELVVLHLASARDVIDAVSEHVWDDLSGYAQSELTDAFRHIDNAIADIESQSDSTAEPESDQPAHPWDKFTDGSGPERL
jgi:hypothetical protein